MSTDDDFEGTKHTFPHKVGASKRTDQAAAVDLHHLLAWASFLYVFWNDASCTACSTQVSLPTLTVTGEWEGAGLA